MPMSRILFLAAIALLIGSISAGTGQAFLIKYTNNTETRYVMTNMTKFEAVKLNFTNLNTIFNLTVNFITPTSAGVTISGRNYTLALNATIVLASAQNYTYYAELLNITYTPISHTASLQVYNAPNKIVQKITTSTSVRTTSTSSIISVVPTTTIANGTSSANTAESMALLTFVLEVAAVAGVTAVASYLLHSRMKGRKKEEKGAGEIGSEGWGDWKGGSKGDSG